MSIDVTLNGFRFNKMSIEFNPHVHERSFDIQATYKIRYRLPTAKNINAIMLELEANFYSSDRTTMQATIETQGEFRFSHTPTNLEKAIQEFCLPQAQEITIGRLQTIMQTMDFQQSEIAEFK